MKIYSKCIVSIIVITAFVCLFAISSADILIKYDLAKLAKEADEIIIGKCSGKQAQWVNKHVETTFEITVQENLKGNATGTLAFTQMGGTVQGSIFSHVVPGNPQIQKNEELVLFLRKTKPVESLDTFGRKNKQPSKIYDQENYSVLGLHQGKYTVQRDKNGVARVLPNQRLPFIVYVNNKEEGIKLQKSQLNKGQQPVSPDALPDPVKLSEEELQKCQTLDTFKNKIKEYMNEK